jgi:two-component system sensor histidine kinase YesM
VIQTANNIESLLGNIEDISLQIVSMKQLKSYGMMKSEGNTQEEYIRSVINNVIGSRNEIVGVNILFANQDKYLVYGEPLVELANYKQSRQYMTTIASTEKTWWFGTYKNPNDIVVYTDIAVLARKIIDDQSGKVIGVLLIGIREFSLADSYSYVDMGPNGYYFIIDSSGYIVSDLNKRKLGQASKESYISRIISKETAEDAFTETSDGEKILITYDDIELTDWTLISVVPYDYLMKEIRQGGQLTGYVVVVFVILSIFISALISLSIFKPIEKINEDMRQVRKGNLNVRSEASGCHEINEMSIQFNKMIDRIDYLVNQIYEFKIMKQAAEIHALHAQINPHFLYNALAVIDGMALREGNQDISEVSQLLASIFRYSTSGDGYSKLEEEIKQIEDYIKLQALRKSSNFSFEVTISEEIKDALIPKLLLQPIAENCFIHGFDMVGRNAFIQVKAVKTDDEKIDIRIIDNGKGMTEEALEDLQRQIRESETKDYWTDTQSGHIGLKNVYQRILNFSPEFCNMTIKSIEGVGTEVKLSFSYITEVEHEHHEFGGHQ